MILQDKIKQYEDCYDYRIMPQVPIIVKTNMRNYDRIIKHINNSSIYDFNDIASNTLFASIKEIEGALFGFYSHGEYTFVLRNDLVEDSPIFYNNKIQTISSVVSSLLTNNFMKHFLASDNQPNVSGEIIFSSLTFPVPNINEAINLLILKQKECKRNTIDFILNAELKKLHEDDPKNF
jgi:tRNA(His) 5'-end guanylyltransferase